MIQGRPVWRNFSPSPSLGSLQRDESECRGQEPKHWHLWRNIGRSYSGTASRYALDKPDACSRRPTLSKRYALGTRLTGSARTDLIPVLSRGSGGIDTGISESLSSGLTFAAPNTSMSSPTRRLNLRLLASLLRPSAAHGPPTSTHAGPPRPQPRPFSTSIPHPHGPSSTTSSVSETEVSHFSRLAASWWDPHGSSRLLHLMNPLRHEFIHSCLQSTPAPEQSEAKHTYLDIGCGGGIFSSSAARLPATESVTAIDATPSVIAVAKAHQRSDPALSEPRLRYLNCAVEDLPLPSPTAATSAADIVSLFEVLEHIDLPSQFLQTTIQHLKPGGWLIGSTIARSPLSFLTTKLIAEAPVIGVVPRGTHDWNKYINPSELAEWFHNDGRAGRWAPMRTQGVIYLPGIGWKMWDGSEDYGNYFFGVQKLA